MNGHERYMALALLEAKKALQRGEVPVGAVIVRGETVLAAFGNEREQRQDATAHAEMLAIQAASRELGSWRLDGCTAYVTLEPCVMCACALVQARVGRIVFGTFDEGAGGCGGVYKLPSDARLGPGAEVLGGVMQEECAALLRELFRAKR